MGRTLMVALVGIVVVFAVLILIIFCIKLYSFLVSKSRKGTGTGNTHKAISSKPSVNLVSTENNSTLSGSNTEMIAAITAAIMACMQDSGSGLRVKSIRRIGHTTPIWNVAGRNEYILSKM